MVEGFSLKEMIETKPLVKEGEDINLEELVAKAQQERAERR